MMKLVQTAAERSPWRKVPPLASMAWALSSMTFNPCFSAMAQMAGMSAHWPYRCTGTISFVLGVIAASISFGSMHLVWGSQSTKTTVAPTIQAASAVAKKVLGCVMTSSPGPMPSAIMVSQSASVPLPTPMACFMPVKAANSFSNFSSIGPITYLPLISTSLMLASISALMFSYCRTCP